MGSRFSVFSFQSRAGTERLARSLATAVSRERRARRGVTLLEVLISIGVVAVGLLGVASLIPIGTFSVNETAKSDRSAALGRAAMHEVRVRGMLERVRDDGAARWYLGKSGLPMNDHFRTTASLAYRRLFLIGQPFAIDPMFATEAVVQQSNPEYSVFPFDPRNLTDAQFRTFIPFEQRIIRLRLDMFEDTTLRMEIPGPPFLYYAAAFDKQGCSANQLPVVNRIFTWQDDLIFDLDEDDPDRRPRQSCVWSDGAVAPYATPSAGGPTPLRSQAEDNYTWMLTAVPDPTELPNKAIFADQLAALDIHRQKNYTVSVVTFYKRDFTCDANDNPHSERFVQIEFNGTGIGGGDAELRIPSNPPDNTNGKTKEQAEEYLKVKENEWVMVTAYVLDPRLDAIFGVVGRGQRKIAKWYRVIRVDDEVVPYPNAGAQTHWARNITLAGPDLVPSFDGHATLIDGAIGVYTTTVTIP